LFDDCKEYFPEQRIEVPSTFRLPSGEFYATIFS